MENLKRVELDTYDNWTKPNDKSIIYFWDRTDFSTYLLECQGFIFKRSYFRVPGIYKMTVIYLLI